MIEDEAQIKEEKVREDLMVRIKLGLERMIPMYDGFRRYLYLIYLYVILDFLGVRHFFKNHKCRRQLFRATLVQ